MLILIAPSKNSIKWLWSYKKLEYNISGIILVYDGLRQLEKSTASNLKTTGSRFQWAHGMDNLQFHIQVLEQYSVVQKTVLLISAMLC